MAQTLRRQQSGVRRQARAQGTSRKVRSARARTSSWLGRALALLPFTEEQLHRAFVALIMAGVLALTWVLAGVTGARDMAAHGFARVAANAGFAVRHVEVRGTHRMNEMLVYERALGQQDLSMAEVDLDALRADLLRLSWVKDARVSRQLPDTLVIDIIERTPHAVLRRADHLLLIDASGVELEAVSAAGAKDTLLIEGPGAQGQVQALDRLLDAAPALREHVAAAEWVGNRRWNLTFGTGQKLALPEGPQRAAAALVSFARADGVHRLLGGEVVAFDLRNPPRMYMRVPGHADRDEMQMGGTS